MQIDAFLAGNAPATDELRNAIGTNLGGGSGGYIQIGKRRETAFTGDNCTHNHYNADKGTIRALRAVIRDKDSIIKEQKDVIDFLQKTIQQMTKK